MSFDKRKFLLKLICSLVLLFLAGENVLAQSVGDFRSVANGEWTSSSSWQVFDGSTWTNPSTYPGQNSGTYAVTILAGHTITTSGVSTQPMGTLTISGTLRLNGSNAMVNFFFNTPLIYVTPDLTPRATIFFNNKSNLVLPQDAVLRVWLGGLSGDCNNNQKIQIGTLSYAACNGAPGSMFTFAELMAGGGTLNSIGMIPPLVCQGNTVQLQGNYSGAIGTPVTYNWSSSGPAVLNFSPSNTAQNPTITPTVPGSYAITLTVSTNKGTQIYSNTESSALIVAPTSSVTNAVICEGESYPFSGMNYSTTGTYSTLLSSVTTGCDSTAVLNLSVIAVSSVINDTICEGETYYLNGQPYTEEKDTIIFLGVGNGVCNNVRLQLRLKKASEPVIYNESICLGSSYDFYGNTYYSGGTYTARLINAVGCDSTVILNLTVLAPSSYERKEVCSSDLPYVWNSKEYNFEGIYKDTIPNANSLGCDSIVTLELVIKEVTYSTTNVSICSSDFPYTWNGTVYPVSGTYTQTFINSVGCDSIATLVLSEKLATASTTDVSICSSDFPYTWNGTVYPVSGTYTQTFINSFGCDSIATLVLSEKSATASTTEVSICSSDFPYTWNGTVYPVAGTYTQTFINSVGCDSIATLVLSEKLATASTTNVSICSSDFPYTWNGTVYPVAGTYTQTFINSVGCDSIATLVLSEKSATASTTDVSICSSDFPYTWNGTVYPVSGTYTQTFINSVGCDSIATLVLSEKLATASTTDVSICSSDFPYTWNGTVYPVSGTYTQTFINSVGCDSIATLVLSEKFATASFNIKTICSSELPYNWDGLVFIAAGTQTKNLTNIAGCDSTANFELTVIPSTSSLSKQTICSTELPYNWDGLIFTAAGTQNKNLTNAAGCDSIATYELNVNMASSSITVDSICSGSSTYTWNGTEYTFAGTYTKKFVNSVGCDSIATLELIPCSQAVETVCPITVSDINVCPNTNAQLNASGANYYFWSPSAGLSNPAIANPIVNVGTTTKYTVTAFSEKFVNLIKNGDFEDGNQDFSSNYTYTNTSLVPEGHYAVGTNPKTFHNSFSACGDHTSGTGKMLIVNGNTTANSKIWGQTITVESNKYYAFYAYVTPVHTSNPPKIQFSINGNVLGTPYTSPATTCSWNKFYAIWYSGSTTTADISIVNQNIIATGNDFAIDDIRYVELCKTVDTVTVSVGPLSSITNIAICNSEFPYTWNGTSYSTAGTYSIHLTSSAGCDSIATLKLTVMPETYSSTSVSVCEKDLPFAWNLKNYSQSGTYKDTLVNSLGCDSVVTLNLTVLAASSVENKTICEPDLPYSWNGLTFTQSESQTTTLKNILNCDSVVTLNLTVLAASSVENRTVCATELPLVWNGLTFTQSGSQTTILQNILGCDSVVTLNLTVLAASSVENKTICEPDLPYVWNGLTFTQGGNQTTTLKNILNCDSVVALNLTVLAASSVENRTVCATELPLVWNGLTFTQSGSQTTTLKNILNCDSVVTMNLTVLAASSVENRTICETALPYVWNGLTFTQGGNQTTTLKNILNCDSVVTLNLTVLAASSVENRTVCATELPLVWNGLTFTQSGSQTTILQNILGCDSVVTLDLTVLAASSVEDRTICATELPYSWNGLTFTQSGSQTTTLKNILNCDSVVTLNLTVLAVSSVENRTVCATELPFVWNGLTFTKTESQTTTLKNILNCDSVVTLNLNVLAASSVENRTVCATELPLPWNGLTFTQSGSQTTTLKNILNCDSVVTLNLTVLAASSIENRTVCEAALPYVWNGLTFTKTESQTTTLKNILNCDSVVTLNLTVLAASSVENRTICETALPYVWNGLTFTKTESQTTTLKNILNCDSVVTLNLNVLAASSVENRTVCATELPLPWNGLTFTQSGSQTTMLKNILNCDSVVTLNLTVLAASSIENKTVCATELPLNWNGLTFTQSESQTTTLKNILNCDSVVTLNLTALAASSVENRTVCATELPLVWNGLTFTKTESQTTTLKNILNCDSVVTLNLTVLAASSVENRTICETALPYVWNGLTFTQSESQTTTLKNILNCDSVVTLNLTVLAASSVENKTICETALPLVWNGLTFTKTESQTTTLKNILNCDSVVTLNLTVLAASSVEDRTICATELPYSWNGLTFTQSESQTTTLKNILNCDSVVTLNLTVLAASSVENKTICATELPLNWNGLTFIQSGTQTTTLKNILNCDSVVTLNLNVLAASSIENRTICATELPLVWNGLTFTQSESQTTTLKNILNCDSVVTLNLNVLAASSVEDRTICETALPYVWNGLTFTKTESQTTTLKNILNCDSVVTLNLTVLAASSVENRTICETALPYSWNGLTFTQSGSQTTTLKNILNCDSVVTLNLTVLASSSVENKTICATELPLNWNGLTFTQSGSQTATLKNILNCDSVVTLNLTVLAASSVENRTICETALPLVWNGLTFTKTESQTTTLKNILNCDSVVTLNLTVLAASSIENQTICETALPYVWNGLTFTKTESQTTTLKNILNCDSVVTLNLTVLAASSVENRTVCATELPLVWNGLTFTQSGSQTTILQNILGCDSVVTLNLTVLAASSIENKTVCATELPLNWNGLTFTQSGSQTTTLKNILNCDSVVTLNLTVLAASSVENKTICATELPLVWNGLTFTKTESQTTILKNILNCDSVVTLNLTVLAASSVENRTVCATELPLPWNGLTFTQSESQTTTLKNILNCDSVVTLNLTVLAASSVENKTICETALPYVWNGLTFTQSGSQTTILQSILGCDSVVTLNLTVLAASSIENQTICETALPYVWNSLTFTKTESQTTTLKNILNCDSVVTLNLTVLAATSVENRTICATELPLVWNGLTFTKTESQTTILKNILNCDSVVTLNLTVLAASSVENKTVCETELPYSWNGLTFTQSESQTTTLKNILNCDSVVTMNLTVLATTYSITEATVCQKDLPYIWNDRNYTESGVFKHALMNLAGCDSIATLELTVIPPTYTTTLATICRKDLPYIWNTKSLTESGVFIDTLINSFGCDSIVTLELSVIQTTYSTTKRVICPLQIPFIWNDIPCFGEGTYTKILVNSNGCDSIAMLDLRVESPLVSTTEVTICQSELPYRWNKITCNAAGTYNAFMKTAAGCDSVATLVLMINRPTSAMKSTSVCEGESFRFNGMYYSPGSYLVNLENTNGCDSLVTLVINQKKGANISQVVHLIPGESYTVNGKSYRNEGVYTEVMKNENSCDSVVVTEIVFINVPNTITPNGDGLNDVFMEGWKVKIYNRNGILLHDGSNGWDGKYKGTPVSQDTYFYVLFFDSESGEKTKEGYLTVVR